MKKKREDVKIFPLSANPKLTENEEKALRVYYQHLDAAFSEPRIHNIAITGAFGIGKSSLIQSYEKRKRGFRKKNEFLYISLGNYIKINRQSTENGESPKQTKIIDTTKRTKNPDGSENIVCIERVISTEIGSKDCDDNQKCDEEKNALEQQLLLQMFAKFNKSELPATSFKMVPETRKRKRISACVGLVVLAVLLLVLYPKFVPLTDRLFSFPAKLKTWFHLAAYGVIITILSVGAVRGIYSILPKFQAGKVKFSVKTENAEAEYENDGSEDYLDRNTIEILYCLEQIAKHNNTIVFEDMDRLDEANCLLIFQKLRELNHLVNARLSRDRKHLRFLYVVNDSILAKLHGEKFFDYILPIIPIINKQTVELILNKNLKDVNSKIINGLKCYNVKNGNRLVASIRHGFQIIHLDFAAKWLLKDNKKQNDDFVKIEESIATQNYELLVHIIAKYLSDYRTQNNILNEYDLLFRIYLANNIQKPKECIPELASRILAFTVYKNIWPEDYERISKGNSYVFPICEMQKIEVLEHVDLLQALLDKSHPFLSIDCLFIAGFSRTEIVSLWKSRLEHHPIETLAAINEDDYFAREAVESQWDDLIGKYSSDEDVCAFIRYSTRTGFENTDWFFTERTIENCLSILEQINDTNTIKIFFSMGNKSMSVFEKCRDKDDCTRDIWTQKQLDIFTMGTEAFWIDNKNIWIKDKDITVNLKEYVTRIRKQ